MTICADIFTTENEIFLFINVIEKELFGVGWDRERRFQEPLNPKPDIKP